MGLLPGFYVPLQMLSHPPLPLFATFLSTQQVRFFYTNIPPPVVSEVLERHLHQLLMD